MGKLKAVLIGALAAAIRLTFAQEFDLEGRGDCSANDEEGACKDTRGETLGSNTVVEVIGAELLETPHPRFKVGVVHFTNDGEGMPTKGRNDWIQEFDNAADALRDAPVGFARVDLSRWENEVWLQQGFPLETHRFAIKLSFPADQSPSVWVPVRFVPDMRKQQTVGVNDQMLKMIKRRLRLAIIILNILQDREWKTLNSHGREQAVHDFILGQASSTPRVEDHKRNAPKSNEQAVNNLLLEQVFGIPRVEGALDVREGFLMKRWKKRYISVSRGVISISGFLENGEVKDKPQKMISLEDVAVRRGCRNVVDDSSCFSIMHKTNTGTKANKKTKETTKTKGKDKMKVLLELRAFDSRAAEQWVMCFTVQQRLIFDDKFAYSPFASTFASEDAMLSPVTISPVELNVMHSPASVDCLVHLTAEEMIDLGVFDLDPVIFEEARNHMRSLCRVFPVGNPPPESERPSFYQVVKNMLMLRKQAEEPSRWERSPTEISMSWGRDITSSVTSSRSPKGWHAPYADAATTTATSPTSHGDPPSAEADDDAAAAIPNCVVSLAASQMSGLGLVDESVMRVRGRSRAKEKKCLVVTDNGLPEGSVGTSEGIRKILGVKTEKDKLLVVRPALFPPPRAIPTPRFDTLGPDDPPLIVGEHISSACANPDHSALGKSKPPFPPSHASSSSSSDGICLYVTPRATLVASKGHEPDPTQDFLFEVGGGRKLKPGERVEVAVEKGCLTVTVISPAAPGGFFGPRKERRTIIVRSMKPKGYWKTFLGRFLKGGREILDAQARATPDGKLVIETPQGKELLNLLEGMLG